MEKVLYSTGGQPINANDLALTDFNLYELLGAQFRNLGAFALTGLEITGNIDNATISGGIIILNNKVITYYGATGLNFLDNPLYFISEANTNQYRPKTFADGNIKNTRTQVTAITTINQPPSGGNLQISYDGTALVRLKDAMLNTFVRRGVVWDVAIDLNTTTEVDSTGKGINLWKGWAVCNGQNGTPNLMGRVRVGVNPNDADFYPVGKFAGEKGVTLTSEQSGQKQIELTFPKPSTESIKLATTNVPSDPNSISINNNPITISGSNATESHNNLQPYMVVVPMMKL